MTQEIIVPIGIVGSQSIRFTKHTLQKKEKGLCLTKII